MRIASPCTENLDRMARTPDGSFCTKCEKNVVDLRRAPAKRALAVIARLRAEGDGQVCVRVRATRDGVPVFPSEPSRLARLALPMVFAGSLAACVPSSGATGHGTTPIAVVAQNGHTSDGATNGNGRSTTTVPVSTTSVAPVRETSNVSYPTDIVEMAGGMAFTGP